MSPSNPKRGVSNCAGKVQSVLVSIQKEVHKMDVVNIIISSTRVRVFDYFSSLIDLNNVYYSVVCVYLGSVL